MKHERKVINNNTQINICKEVSHLHNRTSKAARRCVNRALGNDDKKLAVKTATEHCIWKAQHFRLPHHLQTQQNIIFDII
jgi:hypothetical protein